MGHGDGAVSVQAQPRLPLEPMLKVIRGTLVDLAERTGIDQGTLYRDHLLGGVTPFMADRVACGAGYTPDLIWDEWRDLPDGALGPVEEPVFDASRERRRERDRARYHRQQEQKRLERGLPPPPLTVEQRKERKRVQDHERYIRNMEQQRAQRQQQGGAA